MKSCMKIVVLLCLVFSIPVYAVPKEIILIRHADKLDQPHPGPFLSPLGQVRAQRFAAYYLDHYHDPDFIITTAETQASDRELQTIMPLVTELAIRHPTKGQPVLLSGEYKRDKSGNARLAEGQLKKIANDLLNNPKFDGKTVLICWYHSGIPKLLDRLGAQPHQHKLDSDNYDTVYDVKFDKGKKIETTLVVLSHQYPVESE